MSVKSVIKHWLDGSLKPSKNLGFNDKPNVDVIDAPYEVLFVSSKKNGTFVGIKIYHENGSFRRVFNAEELIGLDTSPCVGKDNKYGIDESMLVTWTYGMNEPSFNPGA